MKFGSPTKSYNTSPASDELTRTDLLPVNNPDTAVNGYAALTEQITLIASGTVSVDGGGTAQAVVCQKAGTITTATMIVGTASSGNGADVYAYRADGTYLGTATISATTAGTATASFSSSFTVAQGEVIVLGCRRSTATSVTMRAIAANSVINLGQSAAPYRMMTKSGTINSNQTSWTGWTAAVTARPWIAIS